VTGEKCSTQISGYICINSDPRRMKEKTTQKI